MSRQRSEPASLDLWRYMFSYDFSDRNARAYTNSYDFVHRHFLIFMNLLLIK